VGGDPGTGDPPVEPTFDEMVERVLDRAWKRDPVVIRRVVEFLDGDQISA
jgi:hypothetical protein